VETFRQSEWAHRAPAHVEVPVETRIGDVVVRGRIDAVFRDADGRWDLVDWKTGRRPSAAQLKVKAVQLAVYRLAWARLAGVEPSAVGAAFLYVATGELVRPPLLDEAELAALLAAPAPDDNP
jgi:DNA helicase-2/ATP-dependent DNA helicase PcrA